MTARGQRPRRAGLVAALLLCPAVAAAGHGMLNSFAGIEWLPDPGVTPDQVLYRLDGWRELAELRFAETPDERIALGLRYAREKLAEIEAMVMKRDPAAARRATAAYRDHLTRLGAALDDLAGSGRAALTDTVATALLEHQYIMSTDYADLPRDTRTTIADIMAAAAAGYGELAKGLSRRRRDALFFREEAVRWAWDMALAADAQGL